MTVKRYDRSDRSKKFGVKWGPWKNPRYKFFESKADREEYFIQLVKKEKREGLAALDISTLEAQIMRACVELLGSPQRVIGEFDIETILSDAPENLWKETQKFSGITEDFFFDYFSEREMGIARQSEENPSLQKTALPAHNLQR